MIEIKITAETVSEITTEIQELAQRVAGEHFCDCKEGKHREVTPEMPADTPSEDVVKTAPKKKSTKKAAPKVEEAPKAEEPAKEEPAKTYSVDEVRKAVKDFVQADGANKTKVAKFLHEDLKVKSISEASADMYPQIMEFVGAN